MPFSLLKPFFLMGLLLVTGLLTGCQDDTSTLATASPTPTQSISPLGPLPQLARAEVIFQDETGQLIYTASAEVAGAVNFTRRELARLGWQEYLPPSTQLADDPKHRVLRFKKKGQGLSVYISAVPDHPGQVNVQYNPVTLQLDLPALANATEIEFSDRDIYLHYFTLSWPSQVVAFYRDTLPPQGWHELIQFSQSGAEVARLFFENSSRQVTTQLSATRLRDGRSEVLLRAVSPEEATPTREPTATVTPSPPSPTLDETDLSSAAATISGIPLPGLVEDLNFDGDLGQLRMRYTNPAELNDLLTFYRRELAALGWQEDALSAKVQAASTSLLFRQGDATLTLTLSQLAQGTEVKIHLAGSN